MFSFGNHTTFYSSSKWDPVVGKTRSNVDLWWLTALLRLCWRFPRVPLLELALRSEDACGGVGITHALGQTGMATAGMASKALKQ